ncbi:hypothetical protein BDY19DRAFT_662182 [Irpex rosettiformis]|uniref:Uncharacterized protein n=1 Tax=Irpex rosettiformis TaxID=378272 RepID=A0ACB8TNA4_9APHY|nr:hypothetical protein BDY19DRAFT_662182 [Irpex rosettiformis]
MSGHDLVRHRLLVQYPHHPFLCTPPSFRLCAAPPASGLKDSLSDITSTQASCTVAITRWTTPFRQLNKSSTLTSYHLLIIVGIRLLMIHMYKSSNCCKNTTTWEWQQRWILPHCNVMGSCTRTGDILAAQLDTGLPVRYTCTSRPLRDNLGFDDKVQDVRDRPKPIVTI